MEQPQATQITGQTASHDEPTFEASTQPAPRPRQLVRTDAKLAGVAGGLGAYFDIDPTIIRVLLIVATLVSGPVVPLLYVAAWIVVPDASTIHPAPPVPAPAPVPPAEPAPAGSNQAPVEESHQ